MSQQALYDIFELVAQRKSQKTKIIEFNVGQPDQLPPRKIIESLKTALDNKLVRYSSATGELNLRQALAVKHKISQDNVIIGSGSKFLLYSFLKSIIKNPDDEIIIPTPTWGTYTSMIQDINLGKIKYFKTSLKNNWQIDLKKLEKTISLKTKLIILCSPNNPTSNTIKPMIGKSLTKLARKKNIHLLWDQAYTDLVFDKKFKTKLDPKFNTQIFSFSKSYAMTGFRLGYAIANKQLINDITKFNQTTISCTPTFIQSAGLEAIESCSNFPFKMAKIYKKRANIASKILTQAKLSFVTPQAGFYIFIDIKKNAITFAKKLINRHVAVVPGNAFGDYPTFIRVSLTQSEDKLTKGLNTLVNLLNN